MGTGSGIELVVLWDQDQELNFWFCGIKMKCSFYWNWDRELKFG